MKLQFILLIGIILPAVLVSVRVPQDKHHLLELLFSDEENLIDHECFDAVKDELMRELDDVVDYLVERVENDMPVYRKGLRVNIAKLIDEQLLPKHLVDASDDCIRRVKQVYKIVLKKRYGKPLKTIDPDF
ncbi:uncharacterized protein LOC105261598 [Musca domestica]|uniref:Uncharacterized protein LOC105261598 n=1 Tax=Musca domestica TaxID=7370 RepID=A0A1I8NLA3_MUSDO|nr:uncharacterized protein LOC105261598 [Musca domestica]